MAWVAYSPALFEPLFFIDDGLYLSSVPRDGFTLKNILYVLTPTEKPVYLPLVDLTYLIDYAMAGWLNVDVNAWMRVVNVLWLGGSAWWVFRIFNLFSTKNQVSKVWGGLVSLLFFVHPLHAIPTVWIAARKDALVCFMGLGFVYEILRRQRTRALLFYTLAFTSKQSAYGLFLWVMAFDLFQYLQAFGLNRKILKPYSKAIAPFLFIFLAIFPLSFHLSSAHPRVNVFVFSQTLLTYLFYLMKVFVPYPLTHYYGRPPALNSFLTVCSFGLIGLGFAAVYWLGLQRKISDWCAGLIMLSFLAMWPYFSVFPAMLLINNSYAYTLVAPCLLLFVSVISGLKVKSNVIYGVIILLIAGSVIYSRVLTMEFCNPVMAFERNVNLYPNERFLRMRLAQAAHTEENYEMAQRLYLEILNQRMQQERKISIEAFDGLTDICTVEKDTACLNFLIGTATRNSHAFYCRHFLEKNIAVPYDFSPCLQKYPNDFRPPS